VEQASERPRHLSVLIAQLWGPFRPLEAEDARDDHLLPGRIHVAVGDAERS